MPKGFRGQPRKANGGGSSRKTTPKRASSKLGPGATIADYNAKVQASVDRAIKREAKKAAAAKKSRHLRSV